MMPKSNGQAMTQRTKRYSGKMSLAPHLLGNESAGKTLRVSHLAHSDFSYADLRDASFRGSDCLGADFEQAILQRSIFRGARIKACDFFKADARGSELSKMFDSEKQISGVLSYKRLCLKGQI